MAARSAKTVRVANVRIAKSREVAVGIGDFAAGDDWKSRAALIADALPRLEADGVLWEVLLFLKPANRLSRFARYRECTAGRIGAVHGTVAGFSGTPGTVSRSRSCFSTSDSPDTSTRPTASPGRTA